jgi:hypothetical protein
MLVASGLSIYIGEHKSVVICLLAVNFPEDCRSGKKVVKYGTKLHYLLTLRRSEWLL